MRRAAIILAFVLAGSSAASQPATTPITKDECRTLSKIVSGAAAAHEKQLDAMEKLGFEPLMAKTRQNQELQAAIVAADKAKTESTAAHRRFLATLQDMNYRLQLCGR